MVLLKKSLITLSVVSLLSLGSLYGEVAKDAQTTTKDAYYMKSNVDKEVKPSTDVNKTTENKDVRLDVKIDRAAPDTSIQPPASGKTEAPVTTPKY